MHISARSLQLNQPGFHHQRAARSAAPQRAVVCTASSTPHNAQQQQQQQHACAAPAAADAAQPTSSRRQILRSIPGVLLLAVQAQQAAAAGIDLDKQLPGLPLPPPDLPKAYQRTMHRLVKALRDSIEVEAAGAKEFEVRRKADGAKDLVKEFVGKWRDSEAVVGDVTHNEMKDALSELGRFYQSKGPRARLDDATKNSVLAHLAAVEAALPEEEKSLLGF